MATVYKVEVVSHWISYSKEELEKILTEAVKKIEREKGNEIQTKQPPRTLKSRNEITTTKKRHICKNP